MLTLACLGNITASLLFILAPEDAPYWLYVFPAMVCVTVSMDLVFNQVNAFLSAELPIHQQGIAASLSHALVHLSAPLLLAVAGQFATQVPGHEQEDYTHAFWLQCACGVTSMAIFALLVPMEPVSAQSDISEEEHVTQTDQGDGDQAESDGTIGRYQVKHAVV